MAQLLRHAGRRRFMASLARPVHRSRPLLLFVIEKWCDCNPVMGETNSRHNLLGSLAAADIADYRTFFYDRFVRRTGRSGDLGFLRAVVRWRPDVLIVTIVPGKEYHPSINALRFVRNVLKISLVFVWFDFADTGIVRGLATYYSEIATVSVVLDAPHTVVSDPVYCKRFIPLWTPQDPHYFRDYGIARDIDVSFLGSRENYPDRMQALAILRQLNITLVTGGGQREDCLPVAEYARTLARSKIVINFSRAIGSGNRHQNKGRVYEAMLCGALLMEQKNPQTSHWFDDMVDFVSFETADDLVGRLNYLLHNECVRRVIADTGAVKARSLYNHRRFWDAVLAAALHGG